MLHNIKKTKPAKPAKLAKPAKPANYTPPPLYHTTDHRG